MRRRPLLRLLPAVLVGACSAGELVLPGAPDRVSATATLGGVRLEWPVIEGTRYRVIATTAAELSAASASVTVDDATPPLELGNLAKALWRFRILSTRDGFRAPDSEVLEAEPLGVGTSGLVPLTSPAWVATSGEAASHFGYPVFGAGDVDEDGFDDVLVGELASLDGGTASFYRGGALGLETAPSWQRLTVQTNSNFSKGMSAADFTGDGHVDLLVSSTEWDEPLQSEGIAWIYPGDGSGSFAEDDVWSELGGEAFAFTGRFTAAIGDVNGDDIQDFAVEKHALDDPQVNEGWIGVWHGTTGTFPAAEDWSYAANQADAFLGYSLSRRPGDANGDGYDDLLAGAYQWDRMGIVDVGAAFLFKGGPGGLEAAPSWSAEGEFTTNEFGISLSFAGDVDGDGFDDIVVGAMFFGSNDRGKAYLFRGGPTGPELAPSWTFEGAAQERLGMGVGAAGDVNGDGYDDVAIGAYLSDAGAVNAGLVHLFLGGPSGLSRAPSWTFAPAAANGYAGGTVAPAGDVDGNGTADLAVGTVSLENVAVANGRARVFLGTPREGPHLALTGTLDGTTLSLQLTIDDPAPQGGRTCEVDWGDGQTEAPPCLAGAQVVAHSYASGGPHVVRVAVTNEYGARGSAFAVVR